MSDIIIYTFDLNKENLIKDDFIDEIKIRKDDAIIYVVGNKLDKIEEKDITKHCLENIRNQASELIKQNKINKYFETSCLTGEGIDNLSKHLEIDSSIIKDVIEKEKYKKLILEDRIKMIKDNQIEFLNFKSKLRERKKLENLKKIYKYYNY